MITIEKSRRVLTYTDGKITLSFPVSLGVSPAGHKEKEGDGKTPEGVYRVCSVNPKSKFHFAFGLSYPNIEDAKAALKEKRIGIGDFLKIVLPSLLHLRPAWNTPLGGYVMIHGEHPDGKTGDWTQGCIAMKNGDVDILRKYVKIGEKVEIKDDLKIRKMR